MAKNIVVTKTIAFTRVQYLYSDHMQVKRGFVEYAGRNKSLTSLEKQIRYYLGPDEEIKFISIENVDIVKRTYQMSLRQFIENATLITKND